MSRLYLTLAFTAIAGFFALYFCALPPSASITRIGYWVWIVLLLAPACFVQLATWPALWGAGAWGERSVAHGRRGLYLAPTIAVVAFGLLWFPIWLRVSDVTIDLESGSRHIAYFAYALGTAFGPLFGLAYWHAVCRSYAKWPLDSDW